MVPVEMVPGIHAVTQSVIEEGQPLDHVAELLVTLGALLNHRVPRSNVFPPAALVRLAALGPLQRRVKALASEIELRMLFILAEAGVALEFETSCEIAVQYPD